MAGKWIDVDEGIQECWIASKLEPGWELPLVEIGIIYLNARRNEEARDHLEGLVSRLEDLSWHLAVNLGIARRRCGDTAGTLAALDVVIAEDLLHAQALDEAAYCAFLLRNHTKGARYAKRANLLGVSRAFDAWSRKEFRRPKRNH